MKSPMNSARKRAISLLLSACMSVTLFAGLSAPAVSAAQTNVLGVAGFAVTTSTSSFGGANTIGCSQGNSNWRLVTDGVVGTTSSSAYLGYTVGTNTTPGIDWYTIGNNNSYYLRINLGTAKTVNKMVITCGVLYNLAGCELRYCTDPNASLTTQVNFAAGGCDTSLGSVSGNTNNVITLDFPAVTAKYLELRIDRKTGEFHTIHQLQLFEQEAVPPHTVTYNLNGGSGQAPAQAPVAEGGVFTAAPAASLAAVTPPDGMVFAGGWNTAADGTGTTYAAGDAVTMGTGDMTLYAMWRDAASVLSHHVAYDANGGGGTPPAPAEAPEGGVFAAAGADTFTPPAGMVFKTWNTAADGTGVMYAPGAPVTMGTADMTLYAVWRSAVSDASPAITNLICYDVANNGCCTIQTNLQLGQQAYGDRNASFVNLPSSLLGDDWIRTPEASSTWNGAGGNNNILSFDVTAGGTLYLAWDKTATPLDSWLATDYTPAASSAISVNQTDGTSGALNYTDYDLYSKPVKAGDHIDLPKFHHGSAGVNAMYIVILDHKTAPAPADIPTITNGAGPLAIDSAPDIPTISYFKAPTKTSNWYLMRNNLGAGSLLHTDNADYVSALPDDFKGCDYIQTYNGHNKFDKNNSPSGNVGERLTLFFRTEKDIEAAITVDARKTTGLPAWLKFWTDTGETLSAAVDDGTTHVYEIYTQKFAAGSMVFIPNLKGFERTGDQRDASGGYDNYIIILRNADGTKEITTNNPIVPMGPAGSTVSQYKYYANDTFNDASGGVAPAGYSLTGGTLAAVADGDPAPADLAYHRLVTSSGDNGAQYGKISVVDGLNTSYWQAPTGSAWLDVSLGQRPKAVNKIVLSGDPGHLVPASSGTGQAQMSAAWAAITQNIRVSGSADGITYTDIVPAADYVFNPAVDSDRVTITFPSLNLKDVRLTFANAGSQKAQLTQFRIYGDEMTKTGKHIELTGKTPASLEKSFAPGITGKAVFEFSVKSSEFGRPMSAALTGSGGTFAALQFNSDGYIRTGAAGTAVAPYQPDTWYSVKLIADIAGGKYDVWVNGLLKAQGLAAAGAASVDKLAFAILGGGSGALAVDNVRVYDYTENYLFRENPQQNYNSGAIPAGWTFSDTSAASIADVPFASSRSVCLANDGARVVTAARQLPATSGLATFEARVKPVNSGFVTLPLLTDQSGKVAAAVAFYHNNLYAANGDNWVKVLDDKKDGANPWDYFPCNNWYNVRITFNTGTKRYSLFVDGALRMKDLSFAQDVSSVSRAAFTLSSANTCYINSMDLYPGGSLQGGLIDSASVIDVTRAPYNAKGDGVTNDTEAIQAALDDADCTGKTVLLRGGVFFTSMLTLHSDTTLYIDPSAKILASDDRNSYPIIEDCESRNNHYQIGRAILYANRASNVRIEGGGTVDGNGFWGFRQDDASQGSRQADERPDIFLATQSNDISLQNLRLINSPYWTIVPMESRNIIIRNTDLECRNQPNRDGIDPVDSSNVTIENCNMITGDDSLCLKSSNYAGCANIDVRNVSMQAVANGIKFGTDSFGPLTNLSIKDAFVKNVELSGIAMESSDGAQINMLDFERIDIGDVENPFMFVVGNRKRQPFITSAVPRFGSIKNVVLKDINFYDIKRAPLTRDYDIGEAAFIGLNPTGANNENTHRVQNVLLDNVSLIMPGLYSQVPAAFPNGVLTSYPEINAIGGKSTGWAYVIRFADNIVFNNCHNIRLNPDVRPEIAYAPSPEYTSAPAASDVAVAPSAATVRAGGTAAFTAAVSGFGYPDQTVVWSVEGGASAGTTISGGLLKIGADETASTLTVRAASAGDPGASGTAAVTVTAPLPTHAVTFSYNDGGVTPDSTVTVNDGDTVTRPADPTMTGYTFTGWYLGGAPYDFNAAVAGDIVLTANWVAALVPPTSITMSAAQTSLNMKVGTKLSLKITVSPANADPSVTWSSSNPAVATVDPVTGQVTALKTGSVRITVKSNVNPAVSYMFLVMINA